MTQLGSSLPDFSFRLTGLAFAFHLTSFNFLVVEEKPIVCWWNLWTPRSFSLSKSLFSDKISGKFLSLSPTGSNGWNHRMLITCDEATDTKKRAKPEFTYTQHCTRRSNRHVETNGAIYTTPSSARAGNCVLQAFMEEELRKCKLVHFKQPVRPQI